jgi:hypothetical protein
LNLGQNDISGEIPLTIGGVQNEGHRLINIREFLQLPKTADRSLQNGHRDGALLLNFISFVREKVRHRVRYASSRRAFIRLLSEQPFKNSIDLLWLDLERPFQYPITSEEVIDEYIKAEEDLLLTRIFQNVLKMDPVRLMQNFNSASTRLSLKRET